MTVCNITTISKNQMSTAFSLKTVKGADSGRKDKCHIGDMPNGRPVSTAYIC